MSSHTNPPPEAPRTEAPPRESLAAGYERRDVNIRGILWLAAAVIACAIVVHVGLWILLQEYQAMARRQDPEVSPLAAEPPSFPLPQLQSEPIRDYHQFQAAQDKRLQSYGWMDKREGTVHIPVSRAMDLLVERGLPTPEGPVTPQVNADGEQRSQETPPRENGADRDSDRQPPEEAPERQPRKE
jgi:hypothetical protein